MSVDWILINIISHCFVWKKSVAFEGWYSFTVTIKIASRRIMSK